MKEGNNNTIIETTIAYYISSHGFGHLTRCMAQIEKQIEEGASVCDDEKHKYLLICGEKQIEFARKYLSKYGDRILYREINTDAGLINKPNSLEVDKKALESSLKVFIESWEETVESEVRELRRYNVGEIITDISPIGILAAERMSMSVKVMTNFTWYQQYKHLDLDEEIQSAYLELDRKIDVLYRYPLHLDFSYISPEVIDVDFICRAISGKNVEKIREKYGRSIFVSVGKSADIDEVNIVNFEGTVFVTSGVKVKSVDECVSVYELPVDVEDTQNYIAASEIIISKAGWGTIAEAVCGDTLMVLLEREGVLEDTHNIEEIKKMGRGISVSENQLKKIDYLKLKEEIAKLEIKR